MRTVHPTYYEESVDSAYPFDASTSRSNGEVAIENDAFADARIFPPDGRFDVFISAIEVSDEVTITVSNGLSILGTGTYDRNDPPAFVTLSTTSGTNLGILVGHPVSGLSKISGLRDGTHLFSPSQTRFAATVVAPQPQVTVRSVQLEDGSVFTGDVNLLGEKGVQLTVDGPTGVSSSSSGFSLNSETIRVDVVGDPLFVRRGCTDSGVEFERGRVLKGIIFRGTKVFPDESQGLRLTVGQQSANEQPALRVASIANGIRIGFIGG